MFVNNIRLGWIILEVVLDYGVGECTLDVSLTDADKLVET